MDNSLANSTVCDAAKKIREKNPGRVPIICEPHADSANLGWATKRSKFLVSDQLNIGQFRKFLRGNMVFSGNGTTDKSSHPPRIQLRLRDGFQELADDMDILGLDRTHVSGDGFLYLLYILGSPRDGLNTFKSGDSESAGALAGDENTEKVPPQNVENIQARDHTKLANPKEEKEKTPINPEESTPNEVVVANNTGIEEARSDTKTPPLETIRLDASSENIPLSASDQNTSSSQIPPLVLEEGTLNSNHRKSVDNDIPEYPATDLDADHVHKHSVQSTIESIRQVGMSQMDSMVLSDVKDSPSWPTLSRSSTAEVKDVEASFLRSPRLAAQHMSEEVPPHMNDGTDDDDEGEEDEDWIQVDDQKGIESVGWSPLDKGRAFLRNKLSSIEITEKAQSLRDIAANMSHRFINAKHDSIDSIGSNYPVLGRENANVPDDWTCVNFDGEEGEPISL